MNTKLRLLILYDYFYPGFRAGGPIQSLANLAMALQDEYEVYVITSPRDLHSTQLYSGISINQWTITNLRGSKDISVYYADETIDKARYTKLLTDLSPAVVYFNNIYSNLFFRLPLQVLRSIAIRPKIVICPRGMLQQGALAVKPLKKKLYLAYLKYSSFVNKAYWHATNQEEADDIGKHFPSNNGIVIASNIPKAPLTTISFPVKKAGQLKLIFLSLIAEKKNVLLLLQLMQALPETITLDIYGPVTDENYWKQCLALMQQMPQKVQYKGHVQPVKVQEVISQYHALILLTKGENFGHALYESLSACRPIITSYFTPWNELWELKAGVNVDIENMKNCLKKVQSFAEMEQEEYNFFCKGAFDLAKKYYNNLDAIGSYRKVF